MEITRRLQTQMGSGLRTEIRSYLQPFERAGRLPSSERGGASLDPTNVVVKDVAGEADVFKEEDVEESPDTVHSSF